MRTRWLVALPALALLLLAGCSGGGEDAATQPAAEVQPLAVVTPARKPIIPAPAKVAAVPVKPKPVVTSAAPRLALRATPAPVRTTTAPRPKPRPKPATTTAAPSRGNCDPSYPDVCIAPAPPDLDCPEVPYKRFRVIGADPHRFDADNDGIGCES
jgi:hypothetical protein